MSVILFEYYPSVYAKRNKLASVHSSVQGIALQAFQCVCVLVCDLASLLQTHPSS